MDVRAAMAGDVAAVLPMVRGICALHEGWDSARYAIRDDTIQKYEHWLKERAGDARSVFLYAHDGETPAGFLIGLVQDEIPIYQVRRFGFIADLWVEERYRHEGLARRMALMAVERFAEMGIKQVRLETARANDAARKLFASAGFRESVIEMTLDLQGV